MSRSARLQVPNFPINEIYCPATHHETASMGSLMGHRDAAQSLISSDPSCDLERLPSSNIP